MGVEALQQLDQLQIGIARQADLIYDLIRCAGPARQLERCRRVRQLNGHMGSRYGPTIAEVDGRTAAHASDIVENVVEAGRSGVDRRTPFDD